MPSWAPWKINLSFESSWPIIIITTPTAANVLESDDQKDLISIDIHHHLEVLNWICTNFYWRDFWKKQYKTISWCITSNFTIILISKLPSINLVQIKDWMGRLLKKLVYNSIMRSKVGILQQQNTELTFSSNNIFPVQIYFNIVSRVFSIFFSCFRPKQHFHVGQIFMKIFEIPDCKPNNYQN